jgi:non-canonical (house-cleaning) NTP pyrophosphatase
MPEPQISLVAVGSTSVRKLEAVREALAERCPLASVHGYPCPSGQDAQPIGYEATLAGARSRVLGAREARPDADLFIGIESGLLDAGAGTLDITVVVILDRKGGARVSSSRGFLFPERFVFEARKRGFATTTVGRVIAEHLGGDPTDPLATLTGGRILRRTEIAAAVEAALAQIVQ